MVTLSHVASVIVRARPGESEQVREQRDQGAERAVYAGAKAFQVSFTQALAGELAGTGVQVQVCCPGLIDTEFQSYHR